MAGRLPDTRRFRRGTAQQRELYRKRASAPKKGHNGVGQKGRRATEVSCMGSLATVEHYKSGNQDEHTRHLSKAAEGFAAKLAPRYDGPYQVVDFVSPVICKIRHTQSKKERTVHFGELQQQQNEQTTGTADCLTTGTRRQDKASGRSESHPYATRKGQSG